MDTEEEKQIYLRENILEKGYNAEEFINFLTTKNGDEEVNITNWSLNELKQLVNVFIRRQNGEEFEANAINVNQQQNQISISVPVNPPLNNNNYNNNNNNNNNNNIIDE